MLGTWRTKSTEPIQMRGAKQACAPTGGFVNPGMVAGTASKRKPRKGALKAKTPKRNRHR